MTNIEIGNEDAIRVFMIVYFSIGFLWTIGRIIHHKAWGLSFLEFVGGTFYHVAIWPVSMLEVCRLRKYRKKENQDVE